MGDPKCDDCGHPFAKHLDNESGRPGKCYAVVDGDIWVTGVGGDGLMAGERECSCEEFFDSSLPDRKGE